ncbi:MAG: hypothetical protein AAEJ52_07820 [Myxococcota bacterium]
MTEPLVSGGPLDDVHIYVRRDIEPVFGQDALGSLMKRAFKASSFQQAA